MSRKKHVTQGVISPCIVRLKDQLYFRAETGQMVRVDPQGQQIPRIRMNKKEKLKLRKKLHKINEMDSHELANKIVKSVESVPVVDPKTDEKLKEEQGEIEQLA